MNETQTTAQDVEAGASQCESEEKCDPDSRNGHRRILQRIETVPDIKKDTSGITTQYIAAGIVNLGAFAAGACIAWSSSGLPLLHPLISSDLVPGVAAVANGTSANGTHPRLELTAPEASWAASLLCCGAVFGAIPTGLISQHFGRKKTLLYLALPLVVSWLLVASSPNVYGLYVGRFVGGIAVGAFSVGIPPYVEDIAEKHLVPTLANFYHVNLACGVLFGYVVGMVSSVAWLSLLCATIPIAYFIAFIFLPESPAYLMSQGKYHEAKAALRYFRGIDNNIDAEIKELKENVRNYGKLRVTFKELLTTKITVKALVVSFGLMIFQQMSGIYAVLFYAQYIFNAFQISQNLPGAAIILGFCLVSSTYFSTMLLKTVRRRVLLMISFSVMALSLGILAMYYHLQMSQVMESSTVIPLLALCLFVSVYAAGVGPIPWLMLREIFPRAATRRATAITAGCHWLIAFTVIRMFQTLIKKVRPGWTLWYFSSICVIGLIFVYFFVPETKDRSLEEIQNEFEGIHKKRKHRHVIEVESVSET
ncbi:hypothetical protein ABMA27_009308 [Loxostege sticticalis]|uniref:Major facilitator superfamily (MFS) profile domain-containing protein n=1 Tax=Loxostege sticticalis TaxID=481309 RepID=A0ABR3H7I1_LOXSC